MLARLRSKVPFFFVDIQFGLELEVWNPGSQRQCSGVSPLHGSPEAFYIKPLHCLGPSPANTVAVGLQRRCNKIASSLDDKVDGTFVLAMEGRSKEEIMPRRQKAQGV